MTNKTYAEAKKETPPPIIESAEKNMPKHV